LLYYNGYGAGPKGPPGALPPCAGYAESRVRQLNKSLGERWIQNDRRPLVDSAGPDGEWNDSDDVQMVEDKSLEPSAGE